MNTRNALLILLASLPLSAASIAQEVALPRYVGRSVCIGCHREEGTASSCSLNSSTKHDRAFSSLKEPVADEIAALCGVVESPTESRVCLGCHATSSDDGRRWTEATFDLSDGVQCEACHYAGSLHVHAHRGPTTTPVGAVPTAMLRKDRRVCAECHVARPSHDEVLRHGRHRDPADLRYKSPIGVVASGDGERLYVVCERSDSVVVVDPVAGTVLTEIHVGKRPHDAALSTDGRRLYVTNRFSDTLSVIDPIAGKVLATISVGHEPRGVLVQERSKGIYVLNGAEGSVSVIGTDSLKEEKRLIAGQSPWSLCASEDGKSILVANAQANPSGFLEPVDSEVTVISTRTNIVSERRSVPDANMLHGIAVVPGKNVTLFTIMRPKNLVPMTRLAQGWVMTHGLGLAWPDGRIDQVLLDEPEAAFADPMDIAVSPDGRVAAVTSGGTDQVALIDVDAMLQLVSTATLHERKDVLPNHLGTAARMVRGRIRVGANPRGLTFSPNGQWLYVANTLDDSISVIDVAGLRVDREIRLGGPAEITELRKGERLFHSATHTAGQQFSCRSCHPDGHTNGLTFDIEADGIGLSPMENRSLRGIFDTPPFKWEGTNPTLHRQCGPRLAVFFTRVAPFEPADLDALVRYIAIIERPPGNRFRDPEGLNLAQRRGKFVFERATTNLGDPIPLEMRCVSCHNTPYRTARNQATVGTTMWLDTNDSVGAFDPDDTTTFGPLGIVFFHDTGGHQKRFDAAHLFDVRDGAPFLHNGSAATLEEIWTKFNMYESHGITGDLTRQQFNDLIAYLKSL